MVEIVFGYILGSNLREREREQSLLNGWAWRLMRHHEGFPEKMVHFEVIRGRLGDIKVIVGKTLYDVI